MQDPSLERGSVLAQPGCRVQGLGIDLGLEFARAEVRVDDTGQCLADTQRQQQVVAGYRVRGRDPTLTAGWDLALANLLHVSPGSVLGDPRPHTARPLNARW